MRLIRSVIMLCVFVAAGLMLYNYLNGRGWTLDLPSNTPVDSEAVRERGSEIAGSATAAAKTAAGELGAAVSQGSLTAKIKSKMALDDSVNATNINVDTTGTVVTLTGVVSSAAERERAVRLATETEGVTQVIDKLEMRKP